MDDDESGALTLGKLVDSGMMEKVLSRRFEAVDMISQSQGRSFSVSFLYSRLAWLISSVSWWESSL